MNYDEALSAFLSMTEIERATLLERLIVSLTSYARRYYRGCEDSDGQSLATVNELIHSIGGYLKQIRVNPAILNPKLHFQTLEEKCGNDTELKARIFESVAYFVGEKAKATTETVAAKGKVDSCKKDDVVIAGNRRSMEHLKPAG